MSPKPVKFADGQRETRGKPHEPRRLPPRRRSSVYHNLEEKNHMDSAQRLVTRCPSYSKPGFKEVIPNTEEEDILLDEQGNDFVTYDSVDDLKREEDREDRLSRCFSRRSSTAGSETRDGSGDTGRSSFWSKAGSFISRRSSTASRRGSATSQYRSGDESDSGCSSYSSGTIKLKKGAA